MTAPKTIRMPKELLAKWLAALRSGEYKQGTQTLRDVNGGYCCLGVLQMAVDGAVECDGAGYSEPLPTRRWLAAHGVEFIDGGGTPYEAPHLPAFGTLASQANDSGHSFAEIADAIEACAEGI